eukprot:TRINITY_DN12743_c0_g1_i1.p1 TRINITY_DN12743_c0_g1~~TRINITY_DN12743_c0_g1_i1.p1  ORF type:complete len:343 (-),score=95.28 TRINITY_DN12743_c0_g1_i1:118-1146(-)
MEAEHTLNELLGGNPGDIALINESIHRFLRPHDLVIFVNGILSTPEKAAKRLLYLRTKLDPFQRFFFTHVYNDKLATGTLEDTLSLLAAPVKGLNTAVSSSTTVLGAFRNSYQAVKSAFSPSPRVVEDIVWAVRSAVARGQRVMLVLHSHGTVCVDEALAQLLEDEARSTGVLSLGAPSLLHSVDRFPVVFQVFHQNDLVAAFGSRAISDSSAAISAAFGVRKELGVLKELLTPSTCARWLEQEFAVALHKAKTENAGWIIDLFAMDVVPCDPMTAIIRIFFGLLARLMDELQRRRRMVLDAIVQSGQSRAVLRSVIVIEPSVKGQLNNHSFLSYVDAIFGS